MDTPDARTIKRLVDQLKELRRCVGNPSLGELVKLSQHKMSKTTLNDLLSGRRVGFPPWRLVYTYVVACHAVAQSTGLDPGRLGTLEEWFALREATSKGDYEAVSPLETTPSGSPVRSIQEPVSGDAGTSAAPLLQRLEEDLSRHQASLSPYQGLLVVTNGPKFGALYKVEHHVTTIGRNPDCDIWLNEATVSRHHAEIRHYGDKFTIRDLNSLNGTLRGNRRIAESYLACYDELKIGGFELLFIQGGSYVEGPHLQRHPSVRSGLIRDSSADTADIALFLLGIANCNSTGKASIST